MDKFVADAKKDFVAGNDHIVRVLYWIEVSFNLSLYARNLIVSVRSQSAPLCPLFGREISPVGTLIRLACQARSRTSFSIMVLSASPTGIPLLVYGSTLTSKMISSIVGERLCVSSGGLSVNVPVLSNYRTTINSFSMS